MVGTTPNYNAGVVEVIRSGGHDHLIRDIWWSQLLKYWREIWWSRVHDQGVIVTTPDRSEGDRDHLIWLRRWVAPL